MVSSRAPAFLKLTMNPRTFDCYLANGDVDVVDRAETVVAGSAAHLVHARLVDHGVHADGRLGPSNVRTMMSSRWPRRLDHRVNRHDTGCTGWLTGRRLMMAGRDLLNGIKKRFP